VVYQAAVELVVAEMEVKWAAKWVVGLMAVGLMEAG